MSLHPGTRLGPYEIAEPIGAGGMGEVYRARDTRLDRDVAVKTIKGPFSERFEREARAISALNHPNICTLYDVGTHEGEGYLVMELVEGQPVAGPLPLDQALAHGVQICDALSAAHRKGIVHRDLKPANILLTRQGVKLLDFGLAKQSLAPAGGGTASAAGSGPDHATVAALTGAHTVVGTPQYMAPEQIEGREVDARADIFAFGCVLYELLTGKRAFEGKSTSSVMAAILASEPKALSEVVPLTPPALERVIRRCLEKDPDDRWQSARDVMAELQWIGEGGSRVGLPAVVATRRRTRERIAWAACALAVAVAAVFAYGYVRRAPRPSPVVRFAMPPPDGVSNLGPPAISPDGRMVAFDAAGASGTRQLWVRPLDALEAREVPGTEGASRPFWSPDSRFLAFMAGGKLRKVDVSGGPAQTICDAPTGSDGTWGRDGVILFDGRAEDPILRVEATGGVAKAEVTARLDQGEAVGWPEFLPDGRHYLFMKIGAQDDDRSIMVGELGSAEATEVLKTSSRVLYAEPGYLIYVREQTLVAHPFDPKSLRITGEPIPIGEGLGLISSVGLAAFSISRTGILAFRAGETAGRQFIWVDRNGKESPALPEARNYFDASFSPDGQRLAFDAAASGGRDLWIHDLVRGVTSRFTFDPGDDFDPVWSPDGRRIVYSSVRGSNTDLYVKDASGTGEPQSLLETSDPKYAGDWTRDGSHLLYVTRSKDTGFDLYALPMTGDAKPFPLSNTRFDEFFGTVSPDGRYVAYPSTESGRSEVYVQEFPEARTKVQISTDGGTEPFWRADGRELYYRSGNRVMTVAVETGTPLAVGTPELLFETRVASIVARTHYRPTPDGQRFLVVAPLGRDTIRPTTVVLNWATALER